MTLQSDNLTDEQIRNETTEQYMARRYPPVERFIEDDDEWEDFMQAFHDAL